MSQNVVNFSTDPTGTQLLDDLLDTMQENILTSNSGTSRPSFAKAGTHWIDTTTNPWSVYYYDGSSDVLCGTINTTTHVYTPAGLGDLAYKDVVETADTSFVTQALGDSSIKPATTEFVSNAISTVSPNSFGTSSTSGSTAAKIVTLDGFVLRTGASIFVTFANKNTATSGLTLNVNATGAKPIVSESNETISSTNLAYFPSGYKIEFVYDGTNWIYKRRVVKSYKNGATWYRIYSDGWVEQGSRTIGTSWQTITCVFPIPHIDADYAAFMVPHWDYTPYGSDGAPIIRTKSTGNMVVSTASASSGFSCIWQTQGF